MQYSANTKPLNLELLTEVTWFTFTSRFVECLEVTENIQIFMYEGKWAKLQSKIYFVGQSYPNYLAQIKEIQ